jgi:hypothetical protein
VFYVEDMPAATAGAIVGAVMAKLIRSFGLDRARAIFESQFSNAAECVDEARDGLPGGGRQG